MTVAKKIKYQRVAGSSGNKAKSAELGNKSCE